jgi:hypothetical protein
MKKTTRKATRESTAEPVPAPPAGDPGAAAAWIEYYYARGWSDGLPLVPPSGAAVAAMLAGCLPAYFPVLVAAVRGLCHPDFAYHGPATSTGGSSIALIVSGPAGPRLGINAGNNAFGPGWRANATLGRALRLVMMNVLNTRPGLLDRATLGTPGKYALCFAEREDALAWEPFHVSRGFRAEESTVTLFANNSLCGIYNQLASDPEPLLIQLADALCNLATPNVYGFNQNLLVLAGEHSAVLRRSGWSRRDVQAFLVERARRTVADFKRAGRLPGAITPQDEHTCRHVMNDPDDLLIVCAGGEAGSWSACLPGWGNRWTRGVTVPIQMPGENP